MINSQIKTLFFSKNHNDLRILCEQLGEDANNAVPGEVILGVKKLNYNKLFDFDYISSLIPSLKSINYINFPEAYKINNGYFITNTKGVGIPFSSILRQTDYLKEQGYPPLKEITQFTAFQLSRPIYEISCYFNSPEIHNYIMNELFNLYLSTGKANYDK